MGRYNKINKRQRRKTQHKQQQRQHAATKNDNDNDAKGRDNSTKERAVNAKERDNKEEDDAGIYNLFWPAHTDNLIKLKENMKENDGDSNDSDDEDDSDSEDGYEDGFSQVLDSIVKIHCTHTEPDYLIPWQNRHQSTSTSSGFVVSLLPSDTDTTTTAGTDISLLRIMTNAHSVEYATIVQVQKRGQEHKYEAIVEHLANECDLAILKIVPQQDEPDFFHVETTNDNDNNNAQIQIRPKPLTLSRTLPDLQEEVDVLGFPTGGDSLSVTTGVVSRIEMQEYTQANTNLLAMQVDAAINPGNSGGPVVNEDLEVIGVAFQGLDEAQNIGYVVPVTIAQHLLHDIKRHGQYTGFCSIGASLEWLQNKTFRKSLGMTMPRNTDNSNDNNNSGNSHSRHLSGVMVKHVEPLSPSKGILLPQDVIVELEGLPVANDGKVPFRPGERVSLACFVQTKFKGDKVKLKVLRAGNLIDIECPLTVMGRLVPAHFHNQPPPYLIVAGLVFTVLSIPYLEASEAWEDYQSDQLSYLLGKTHDSVLERPTDQVVILPQVLAHRENMGYDSMADVQLKKLNGKKVRSLAHLKSMIDSSGQGENPDPFLTFEFEPKGRMVVLERSRVAQATAEVCKEQNIQQQHFIPRPAGLINHNKQRKTNREPKES